MSDLVVILSALGVGGILVTFIDTIRAQGKRLKTLREELDYLKGVHYKEYCRADAESTQKEWADENERKL